MAKKTQRPVRPRGARGSIRWRGTSWEIVHTLDGQQHFFTYHGDEDDELGAWSFAQVKYHELLERRGGGVSADMRISDLIQVWREKELPEYDSAKTRTGYEVELRLCEDFFVRRAGNPRVRDIRRHHCAAFRDWRAARILKSPGAKRTRKNATKPSQRTVQKSATFLHLLLERAVEDGVIDINPATRVRKRRGGKKSVLANRRRPEIISSDMYVRLLAECARVDRFAIGGSHEPADMLEAYVLTLGEAGLRPESEALWLRWDDLDFSGDGAIWVDSDPSHHKAKTGHGRWVPMTPILRRKLLALKAKYQLGSQYVFHYTKRGRRRKPGDRIQCMRKRIMSAARRAGLSERWTLYDLRHRRITIWLADGLPLAKVQEAAGHSSPNTTRLYTHFARDHLAELGQSTTVTEEMVREAVAGD